MLLQEAEDGILVERRSGGVEANGGVEVCRRRSGGVETNGGVEVCTTQRPIVGVEICTGSRLVTPVKCGACRNAETIRASVDRTGELWV